MIDSHYILNTIRCNFIIGSRIKGIEKKYRESMSLLSLPANCNVFGAHLAYKNHHDDEVGELRRICEEWIGIATDNS